MSASRAFFHAIDQKRRARKLAELVDVAGIDCDDEASTVAVNDLLPRQGMPQHALDELEVDRLNDLRRMGYRP